MLSTQEILLILGMLGERRFLVVVEGKTSKVIEQSPRVGYSDDPEIGALQAKLSIMLEAARRAGR